MKKTMTTFLILWASLLLVLPVFAEAETDTTKPLESMPFAVYTEYNSRGNHFVPSGWMGDYGAIMVNQAYKDDPHSGNTCIEITYTGEPTQGSGWGGIFWQNPENNWGLKDGGYNLSAAKKLTLWARGEIGGEKVEFKIGGVTGKYPDSDTIGIGPIALTPEWKQYEIGLDGVDMSYISGGFIWAASRMDNPDGFTIFLDDIIYE